MSDASDNRRAPRIRARRNVWCESPNLTLLTQTINLSLSGAFIRVPAPLAPGARVQLRFTDVGVSFQTEVVWARKAQRTPNGSEPPGMGVRFLEGDGRDAYEALLKALATSQELDPITGPRRTPG